MADDAGTSTQPVLSNTPHENTDAYQNGFRNEMPHRRTTNFFGAVAPGKTQFLTTYLGSSTGAPPLRGLLIAMARPDMEMSVPAFSRPGASNLRRAFGLANTARNLRSLLDKPMDLPLQMRFSYAGGEINAVYTSGMRLGFTATGSDTDVPMVASIWLSNPNPMNSGIFSFNVYFLPPTS